MKVKRAFGGVAGLAMLAAPLAAQQPASGAMAALEGPIRAPVSVQAIPVHGKNNPGNVASEVESNITGHEVWLRNVTYPTVTPILPVSGRANGAAVIVAPGGGYMFLALQNEGWRVAQALADEGYTAFVLKYRVRPTPPSDAEFGAAMQQMFAAAQDRDAERPPLEFQPAVDDALAALALVRSRAGEWDLDPQRVGMIGFSAGARTTIDAVQQGGAPKGPNFFGVIYGPMDSQDVPENAPPMFAALAFDDPLFDFSQFPLATAWRKAGRSVELHAYGRGGHGFGLGQPGTTTTGMIGQFIDWADMLGFDKPKDTPR